MTRREDDFEDDGRTVASMADVRRPSPLSGGSRSGSVSSPGLESYDTRSQATRDVADELQSAEERWMVILGTVRAALSVGAVYVVVFGIMIALMVWLWA